MKTLVPVLLAAALLGLVATASAGPARADPARSLGAILEECADARNKSCAEKLWEFADVTGDGRLTLAELTRFFRTAAEALTSPAAGPPGTQSTATPAPALPGLALDDNDRAYAVGSAFITGPIAAQLVIANFDYDDDGVISKAELFLDLDEQQFQRLMIEEAGKLPQRAGGLIMRALQAQQQLGGGAGGEAE